MGLIDRLREMFGGSGTNTPTSDASDTTDAVDEIDDHVEEEFAVERLQHDVASARQSAVERAIDEPGSFDDRR